MPKATIGRDVHVFGVTANGAPYSAAKITRAWSERDTSDGPVAVNLVVFLDACAGQVAQTSVMLFDNEEQAKAHRLEQPNSPAAFWPTRV